VVVVDLGCGIEPRGDIGVDVDRDLIAVWKERRIGEHTLALIIADLRKLPFKANSIDEALSIHSLEHFSWRETVPLLKEWRRILKPNGRITLSVPNMVQVAKIYQHCGDDDPKLGFEAQHRIYGD